MMSAFGVEHPNVIFKRDDERAKHYGRVATTMGALGGTSAALGTGSAVMGTLEHKGYDPMGYTHTDNHLQKPKVPAHKARILQINSKAHGKQAKLAGGIAAGSLAVAGAAHYKKKRELAKRDWKKSTTDAGVDAGTAAAGVAGVGAGGFTAKHFGRDVAAHAEGWRIDSHNIKAAKQGAKAPKKLIEHAHQTRAISRRVVGVKGAGALAGAGIAGLGASGVYQAGKHSTRGLRKKTS